MVRRPRSFQEPQRTDPIEPRRPPEINRIIDRGPDGTDVTVADRIVISIRAGNYLATAAAAVAVTVYTVHEWLRIGALLRSERYANPEAIASDYEEACARFSVAVQRAEAEWEMQSSMLLERLARGGATHSITTTRTDAQGNVIESITKTEILPPNAQVLQWRLSRRHPDRYSERKEVSGPAGAPIAIEIRARAILEAMDRVLHDDPPELAPVPPDDVIDV